MKDSYLRLKQVLARIPVTKSNCWFCCSQGTHSRPIKLSLRATVMLESEFDDFITSFKSTPKTRGAGC